MVKKSFDEHVTLHLGLTILFGNMGREMLLHLSGDYYPNLVCQFYATMLYIMDKNLRTIISIVKRVCIILDRMRLASILGIRNTVAIDSDKKTIQEDPN